ncbi:MAG: MarR family transcriptional regulator [Pirellulales bacterium]|nr:MarR family transcriptional regulator [Pirellulales bacterium]
MARPSKESCSEAFSDRDILDFLRREGACSINELLEFASVTATAIRHRLNRLMEQGLVVRRSESAGRGRPTHQYSLSRAGIRAVGDNYEDLASVLWSEIRAVEDRNVRRGLLKRIVGRMSEIYGKRLQGNNLSERMESLVDLMAERDIPFEVQQRQGDQLPVLTTLACPYPDLAEQDRSICSMEKMLFSEILGAGVKLSACRLDGDNCCTFEASSVAASNV